MFQIDTRSRWEVVHFLNNIFQIGKNQEECRLDWNFQGIENNRFSIDYDSLIKIKSVIVSPFTFKKSTLIELWSPRICN